MLVSVVMAVYNGACYLQRQSIVSWRRHTGTLS